MQPPVWDLPGNLNNTGPGSASNDGCRSVHLTLAAAHRSLSVAPRNTISRLGVVDLRSAHSCPWGAGNELNKLYTSLHGPVQLHNACIRPGTLLLTAGKMHPASQQASQEGGNSIVTRQLHQTSFYPLTAPEKSLLSIHHCRREHRLASSMPGRQWA